MKHGLEAWKQTSHFLKSETEHQADKMENEATACSVSSAWLLAVASQWLEMETMETILAVAHSCGAAVRAIILYNEGIPIIIRVSR